MCDVTVRQIGLEFTEHTTAHGIRHCSRAAQPVRRRFWILAVLGCSTVLLYNITKLSIRYYSHPVRVDITHARSTELPFPAVTLCSLSPVKKSGWVAYLDTLASRRRRKRSLSTTAVPSPCPDQWLFLEDSCYYVSDNTRRFLQAQDFCRNEGAELISVNTEAEQRLVMEEAVNVYSEKVWLGLRNWWLWGDTSLLDYDAWGTDRPGHYGRCVRAQSDFTGNITWYDDSCDVTHGYICEAPLSEAESCLPNRTHNNHCYTAVTATVNQSDAASECQLLGGHLVNIPDPGVNNFLSGLVSAGQSYWIALYWDYVWLDGSRRNYSNWDPEDPDNKEEADWCARVTLTGVWRDIECDGRSKFHYICEAPIDRPSTQPDTTTAVLYPTAAQTTESLSTTIATEITTTHGELWTSTTVENVTPPSTQSLTTVTASTTGPTGSTVTLVTAASMTSISVSGINGTSVETTSTPSPIPTVEYNTPSTQGARGTTSETEQNSPRPPSQPATSNYVLEFTATTGDIFSAPTASPPSRVCPSPKEPGFCVDPGMSESSGRERRASELTDADVVGEVLRGLSDEELTDVSFTASDLIADCQFAGTTCSRRDVTAYVTARRETCYTYNSGWNSSARLQVAHRSGRRHGLQMILNTQQRQYVTTREGFAGFWIIVHKQNQLAQLEDSGVMVLPGFAYDLGVKTLTTSRLGRPHGVCAQEETVEYNRVVCQRLCVQDSLISQCDCYSRDYPTRTNISGVSVCKTTNITQTRCQNAVLEQVYHGKLPSDCACPFPCHETLFDVTVSQATWPADVTVADVYAKLHGDGARIPSLQHRRKVLQQNFLKVNIFYETFNVHLRQERVAYPPSEYISDLGGMLGLCLGCSVLTLAEGLNFLLDLTLLCLSRRNHSQSEQR